MRRASEYLHRERRLHSARALFQKADVLLFGFANAAERSSESNADALLRFLLGIFDSGVVERELGRSNRELRVTIEPFQTLRRKEFLRVPVAHFTRNTNAELRRVETSDGADAGFLGADPVPKTFDAFADASDRPQSGNNNT